MALSFKVKVTQEQAFNTVIARLKENRYCSPQFIASLKKEDFRMEYSQISRNEYRFRDISWLEEETSLEQSGYKGTLEGNTLYISHDYDLFDKTVEYHISSYKDNRFANFRKELGWTVIAFDSLARYEGAETEPYNETPEMAKQYENSLKALHENMINGGANDAAERYLKSKGIFTLKIYKTIKVSLEFRDKMIYGAAWKCEKNGHRIVVDATLGTIDLLEYEDTEESKTLDAWAKSQDIKSFWLAFLASIFIFGFPAYFIVYCFFDLFHGPGDHVVPGLQVIIFAVAGLFMLYLISDPVENLLKAKRNTLEWIRSVISQNPNEQLRKEYQAKCATIEGFKSEILSSADKLHNFKHVWSRFPLLLLVALGSVLLMVVMTKGVGFSEHWRRVLTFDWSIFS